MDIIPEERYGSVGCPYLGLAQKIATARGYNFRFLDGSRFLMVTREDVVVKISEKEAMAGLVSLRGALESEFSFQESRCPLLVVNVVERLHGIGGNPGMCFHPKGLEEELQDEGFNPPLTERMIRRIWQLALGRLAKRTDIILPSIP